MQDTIVVDATGGWLSSWWHRCQKLNIDTLRTPATLHPFPSPGSLRTYAEQRHRTSELRKWTHFPDLPPAPSVSLLRDFCMTKIVRKLPPSIQRVLRDTVVDIQPVQDREPAGGQSNSAISGKAIMTDEEINALVFGTSTGSSQSASTPMDATRGKETSRLPHQHHTLDVCNAWVHLKSGEKIAASAVLVTVSNRSPVVPSWAKLAMKLNLTPSSPRTGSIDNGVGVATWDKIDTELAKEKEIAIVGGGMTAAALALGALSSGAERVSMIARQPLRCQPYDCDVGWWGNKCLNAFWSQEDPEERIKWCRRARPQGTIHPALWRQLAEAAAVGRLVVRENREVTEVSRRMFLEKRTSPKHVTGTSTERQHCSPTTSDTNTSDAFRSSLATTWCVRMQTTTNSSKPPRVSSKTSSEKGPEISLTDFQTEVKRIQEHSEENTNANTMGEADVHNSGTEGETSETMHPDMIEIRVDQIWLACGSAFNATRHSVLGGTLQREYPTEVVAGYPVLDVESCMWPGVPVYVIGTASRLAMGPAADSLAGHRLAAERILRSIHRAALKGGDFATEIQASQARVRSQMDTQKAACAGTSTVTGSIDDVPIHLALEEAGRMWIDPKPKFKITKPPHLVDVSDLPPTLPRHDIQRFVFSDDDFEICVSLILPEPIDAENVRTVILERSIDVWCVGIEGAYHLHVPRLYGRILPDRTQIRARPEKKKVLLVLHKESDTEWKFLKG